MPATPKEHECPECECTFEIDEGAQPGDILECPDCDVALLVEDDGSLTPGEVGEGGDFEADEENDSIIIEDEDDEDDESEDEEDED